MARSTPNRPRSSGRKTETRYAASRRKRRQEFFQPKPRRAALEALEDRREMAVAADDDFHALANQPLAVSAAQGVLVNDQGGPSFAKLTRTTRHGPMQFNADGSFFLYAVSGSSRDGLV